MLPIPNVIYIKCYLDKCNLYEMLHIQSLLYEMLPRPNVTIRKFTIQNVTDPFCYKSNRKKSFILINAGFATNSDFKSLYLCNQMS